MDIDVCMDLKNIVILYDYCLELGDLMKIMNIYAPCCTALKSTYPLMEILDEYRSQEDEMQFELDFSYLKPFVTYVVP